jgi:hypothetical protein
VPDRPDGVGRNLLGATIAGLVLFVAGLVIGATTLEADRADRERRQGFVGADGTVITQIKQPTPEGPAYAPVIAFATASGERVSFTAGPADSSTYPLGAKVPVLYRPGNPADARIDRTTVRRVRSLLAGGASLLLMGLGGYVAWYARRAADAGAIARS